MNSIPSTALEPTRYELQKLSTAQKLGRWIPVYGLVLLTLFLVILFSILLPQHFPNAVELAVHHL